MLTIPYHCFVPYLPGGCCYIRGQLERGSDTEYVHWQIYVVADSKCSLAGVKKIFGEGIHAELGRSEACRDYVWKEETRIDGTQFELGELPIRRNNKRDWDQVWASAQAGDLLAIPASIRVQSYRTLRAIAADYAEPVGMERTCCVYWGRTGSGKSQRAWGEAGMDAYPKDPKSKFWCGYTSQRHVVIDEFRGGIDIPHLLRWLDRYPVIVEIKGSSVVLKAEKIWITSNISPDQWYPDLDAETLSALRRRLNITHFN